ncbi:hypothetical protein EYF80_042147 [Liparis tanakae]|uniref:Uncharacterized protein n=1 Tax=Liparis tanakae TaxID=230148 RepID=A0A4Z2G2B7_9TELE|nr:hypothetical protein EYF80_042147 [Liparis tanakae]
MAAAASAVDALVVALGGKLSIQNDNPPGFGNALSCVATSDPKPADGQLPPRIWRVKPIQAPLRPRKGNIPDFTLPLVILDAKALVSASYLLLQLVPVHFIKRGVWLIFCVKILTRHFLSLSSVSARSCPEALTATFWDNAPPCLPPPPPLSFFGNPDIAGNHRLNRDDEVTVSV